MKSAILYQVSSMVRVSFLKEDVRSLCRYLMVLALSPVQEVERIEEELTREKAVELEDLFEYFDR